MNKQNSYIYFNFSFYLKKVWTKSFRYKFHEKLNVV